MSKASTNYDIPVDTWSELSTSATEEPAATLHLKKRLKLLSRKQLLAKGRLFAEPRIWLHSSAFSIACKMDQPRFSIL